MKNPFAFLKYRIYRRTFLIYVAIMLLVLGGVSGSMLYSAHKMGQEQFGSEFSENFSVFEMKRQNILTGIDRFFFRIYASRSLESDFSGFFGASPEAYMEYHLRNAAPGVESYPEAAGALVAESGYSIRYILYETSDTIIAAEYSTNGYSRYRVLSPQEAAELKKGMLIYTKDVAFLAKSVGRVSFLIDLSAFVDSFFHEETVGTGSDSAVYCFVGDRGYASGTPELSESCWQSLLQKNQRKGSVRLLGEAWFYHVQSSPEGDYILAAVSRKEPYLRPSLRVVCTILLCVIAAFAYITCLYGRQFTKDTLFLQKMLDSMGRAQNSDFTPMDLQGRDDEYGRIAANLNVLYRHLEQLIQQKYVLTINQQRAEMKMLTAQLNPHFLYNTLEVIRLCAIREGAPRAAQATASLGQLYRSIVKTEPVIPLGQELEITGEYLELMSFLNEEQVLYHMDLDPALNGMQTPKIWMQPILENFFKHNFQFDEKIKVVVVQTKKKEDGAVIEFFDNLGSMTEEKLRELNQELTPAQIRKYAELPGKGLGLKNVYLRLFLYYGDRVTMELRNNVPTGVRIRVQIREKTEPGEEPGSGI